MKIITEKIIASLFLLILIGSVSAAKAKEGIPVIRDVDIVVANGSEAVIKEFVVKPNTRYVLSFNARQKSVSKPRWELRILNSYKELINDDCRKDPWQFMVADRKDYSHTFYTLKDSRKLQLVVTYEGAETVLSNVNLVEFNSSNIVVNGDFSAGPHNFSGWGQSYKAKFDNRLAKRGKKEEKTDVLVADKYGYLLSDPIPVIPGATYEYTRDSIDRYNGVQFFDENLFRVGSWKYHHKDNKFLTIPKDVAYIRLFSKVQHLHLFEEIVKENINIVLKEKGDLPQPVLYPRAADEIIVDRDCALPENTAAHELQYWVKQITGKTMSILTKPSARKNSKIFVGRKWGEKYSDDLKFLTDSDGFAVRKDGNNIYIFGARPRGTLFGTAHFLEKNTNIIWPRSYKGLDVVFSKKDKISFTNADFRSRPTFEIRTLLHNGASSREWWARVGLKDGTVCKRGINYFDLAYGQPVNHNSGLLAYGGGSVREAQKRNPEVFPLIDGNRKFAHFWTNPCFTSPKSVEFLLASIETSFKNAPNQELGYVGIFQADNTGVCGCPNCMKPIKLKDGTLLKPESPYSYKDNVFWSTRQFIFINNVAEELVKKHPDVKIVTHAYIHSSEPPLVDIHPAIKPQYAAYSTKNIRYTLMAGKHNDQGDLWERRFLGWLKLKKTGLGFFGYYYPDGFTAVADTFAEDHRVLANSKGFFACTESFADIDEPERDRYNSHRWDVQGLEMWVMAKLMWDPTQDPQKLREYYIERVFREAAEPMGKFYGLIRESWKDPTIDTYVNCHTSAKTIFADFIVKPGYEKAARAYLIEAEKKAQHPTSKTLIQRILARFDERAAMLGRNMVPFVPESTLDWKDPSSPQWEKALSFNDFKQVDNWKDAKEEPANPKTELKVMHDADTLYFRIVADDPNTKNLVINPKKEVNSFPNGDRIEIILKPVLEKGQKVHNYFFAVGVGNKQVFIDNRAPTSNEWKAKTKIDGESWTAVLAIPFKSVDLPITGKQSLNVKLGRVYHPRKKDQQESTISGKNLFDTHENFWNDLTINFGSKQ
jgi:hypothetical protein